MRFLIFNIVVAGALAFLVLGGPGVTLNPSQPGELSIPLAAMTQTQPVLEPQQYAPVKAEPTPASTPVQPKPKIVEAMPPLPPAQEVPVRTTHKAPRDVSPGLTEAAEAIKAEITARQNAPLKSEVTQTAAMQTDGYDKAVSRRKALLDLASDMENMFVEKMMR